VAAAMATVGIRGILAERSALEAVRLHELEDWEEALELASRSTVLAPHEHAYWVLLAEMANKAALAGVDLGRTLPMTFDAYRQAGRTYPDHAPTYGRAGALYLSHADAMPGAVDSAEVYLRRAIALNPYYADPHTNLGTVLMLVGDYEAARTELLRAGKLDTASATPLFNLGNLESTLGNVSAAVMDYRTALEREPSHVGALINLSILLIADGQLSEAEEHLRAALHVDPGLGQAKALLSTIEEARR
jgi:tetratricopeptide (TPR) repeat protein